MLLRTLCGKACFKCVSKHHGEQPESAAVIALFQPQLRRKVLARVTSTLVRSQPMEFLLFAFRIMELFKHKRQQRMNLGITATLADCILEVWSSVAIPLQMPQ